MITLLHPPVIVRPRDDLARLLGEAPALGREHHWEGDLVGSHGAALGCTIRVKASIGFHGALIEGSGRAVNFPAEFSDADSSFALSGLLAADSVSFQIWFGAALIGREPFVGTGELSHDGREMVGDWKVGCFSPDSCGCDGGGGTFRLRRID